MPSSEDMLDDFASLSVRPVPYKTFLSNLSKTDSALRTLPSLSLESGLEIDRSVAIARLSLLLITLGVPGPYDLLDRQSFLGHGAQFNVVKSLISGMIKSGTAAPVSTNSRGIVAIKTPIFLLGSQQKLDLSNPKASKQVRNMIIEITALYHPSLRDHRNIVDLWGWGVSEDRVPFLALEVANSTLATFLCESRVAPIALKYHIALDIGCALDALHEIGLIHGDLKPENVLMFYKAGDWIAKLADFGGGADIAQGGILEGRGTVGWRSPELRQFFDDGTQIDPSLLSKTDNYSYGLLLWSMFLKEKGLPPCAETVEAEMVALSELKTNAMSLPMSLYSALKSSLGLLLKQYPRIRAKKVGHLLHDGSREYYEWMLLKGSRSETFPGDSMPVALPQGNNIRYDWEIPEISMDYVEAVGSAFTRNEPISTEMIQSLVMKYAGSHRLVYSKDSRVRDLILDLLYTGSKKGSQPLRALIYTVHEHFQIAPRADLSDLMLLWMSEAVVSGAFFLRKSLQYLNSSLLEKSIQTFQDHGGYNRFYAELNQEALSEILMRTSIENAVHLNWKMSLNPRGDKLLHILSSTTAFKGLGNIVRFMSPREVNTLNACGETGLYRACMAGATTNVLLLLSYGADPSIVPSHGGPTCLHWLFHFNPRDVDVIARELVTHGASIHAQSERRLPTLHYPFTLPVGTPLHWAVENSAVEATRSLLCQGADSWVRDGSDPYACDENVRLLEMCHPPDMRMFSVAKHTVLGFNAIDVAVKNRDHEILAVLLSNDTSFGLGDTDEEGYGAMHRLNAGEWQYTLQGSAIWCRLFQGPPASQADSLKKTIAILLQHGFETDRLTNEKGRRESGYGFSGQTALMIAVAQGDIETIKQLLNAGADVNVANSKGETALQSFTDQYLRDTEKQSTAAFLLLDANANVHARDGFGQTPFLAAASRGLFDVATALLNHGADLRDRDTNTISTSFGQTAFAVLSEKAYAPGSTAKIDEWLVNQLNTRILPRIAANEDQALHNELLEKADLDGGTLLHYTAKNGLIRSCAILLEAKVSVNKIRRGKGRRWDSYSTALDEALNEGGLSRSTSFDLPRRTEQEKAELKGVFQDIVKLLRNVGGVEAKDLIDKQFGIPPRREKPDYGQEKPSV